MDEKMKAVEPLETDREIRGETARLDASESGYIATNKLGIETDDDGRFPMRSGTWKTACAHIITAVIGSGVLSLGWSIAQMGWVFGPIVLFMFSVITWYTASLLCETYRTGDPTTGKRNYTYMMAVKSHLGPFNQVFCCIVQLVNLFATGVGYTVTGSLSIVAAKRAGCFNSYYNKADPPCSFANIPWMLFFGGLQIVFSQIPDFGGLWWLSYLATLMSFLYAFIGLGLSIGQATERGHADYGTAWGVASEAPPAEATWNIFVALGSMAFAYSFSMILIEIQDTLKQPPSEENSMKKATKVSIIITTAFYMSIGCISYAGFGNSSPGNLITGFGFYNPYWLVGAANVFVFIHLIGAYQVFMQPFMTFIEESIQHMFPTSKLLRWEYAFNMPCYGLFRISPLRLISRTLIVCLTTLVAIILPFFNDLVGFIGALGFWPLTVYFPVEMHITARKIPHWSRKWLALQALSMFTLAISLAAAIGSISYVIADLKTFQVFSSVSSSTTN